MIATGNPSAKLGKTRAEAASSSWRTPWLLKKPVIRTRLLKAELVDALFNRASQRTIPDDNELEIVALFLAGSPLPRRARAVLSARTIARC